MERMRKKGAAHFEMIISFVLFVGFVFFLFMVLKPDDNTILSSSAVSALWDNFEERVRTNLSTMLLRRVGDPVDDECFKVELPYGVFDYGIEDGGSYVTFLNGTKVNSTLKTMPGGSFNLNIDLVGVTVEDDRLLFKVAMASEFHDEERLSCNSRSYELGGVVEREVVSKKALENISNQYFDDYEGLREELRVPEIFDFAIVPESFPVLKMEPSSGISDSVEVMARDYIAEVLDEYGNITNERFTLKIW